MSIAAHPARSRLRRWLFRPQFSLRTFLLAVTAVGLGFPAWYRWPYEESVIPSQEIVVDPYCGQRSHKDADYEYSRVTKTWQRQFGGPRLQHGWHRKYGAADRLLIEQEYRNGKLHGVCRTFDRSGRVIEEGRFEHDRPEGEWISRRGANFERRGLMRQGKRDGEWVSRQLGYERRVRFRDGRVIAVDGVPVDRAFEARFPSQVDDEGVSFRPLMDRWTSLDAIDQSLAEILPNVEFSCDAPLFLDESVECDAPLSEVWGSLPISDALLILGMPHGLMPVHRYGGICLAPAGCTDKWADFTGVSELKLPAESPLLVAWNAEVHLIVSGMPLAEGLTIVATDLGIEIDVSAITSTADRPEGYEVCISLQRHPFHYTLAYLLYKTRCHCRLDGDTLVILPPPDELP